MKTKILLMALAASLFACSGEKQAENNADENNTDAAALSESSLAGKWRLTDYAGDGLIGEMDETQNYYLEFTPDDNTFGITTDCNSIGGQYKIVGDSLVFANIAATQMACPDETVENAMKIILPMITSYTLTPDSVLMLRSDARIMARFTPAH